MIYLIFFINWLGPGETGYNFLKLGIGARAVAMGSAFTAVSDDANSLFWNPSGIGLFPDFAASLMIMSLFSDVTYGTLGTKLPIGRRLGLGIGGAFLSAKDWRRDEVGEEKGEYYFNNFLLSSGLGISPSSNFALGLSIKGLACRLDTFFTYSFALDGGLLYSPLRNLFLGSSLLHFGTPQRLLASATLPLNWRLGFAYKIPISKHQLTLASDVSFYIDNKPIFSFGGELTLRDISQRSDFLSFRAGYETGHHLGTWKGISFGLGYGRKIAYRLFLVIDATYFDYGYVGYSERVSISLKSGVGP